jgi:23S rRNA pseudouridine1911/1915/1917 synthase
VLCDRLYGGRAQITRGEIERRREDDVILLNRQALHARRLKIRHPVTQQPLEFEAPIPADIQGVLDALRQFRRRAGRS